MTFLVPSLFLLDLGGPTARRVRLRLTQVLQLRVCCCPWVARGPSATAVVAQKNQPSRLQQNIFQGWQSRLFFIWQRTERSSSPCHSPGGGCCLAGQGTQGIDTMTEVDGGGPERRPLPSTSAPRVSLPAEDAIPDRVGTREGERRAVSRHHPIAAGSTRALLARGCKERKGAEGLQPRGVGSLRMGLPLWFSSSELIPWLLRPPH